MFLQLCPVTHTVNKADDWRRRRRRKKEEKEGGGEGEEGEGEEGEGEGGEEGEGEEGGGEEEEEEECCQVEVSATDWSLVQRSPIDCGASLCVITKPRKRGG